MTEINEEIRINDDRALTTDTRKTNEPDALTTDDLDKVAGGYGYTNGWNYGYGYHPH